MIAATNPGPAFPADALTSAPQSGVADWALSTRAGAAVLRGVLAGARMTAGVFPKFPPAKLVIGTKK